MKSSPLNKFLFMRNTLIISFEHMTIAHKGPLEGMVSIEYLQSFLNVSLLPQLKYCMT